MGGKGAPRRLRWIGSSLVDLKSMPATVQRAVGGALWEAQLGQMPRTGKPLRDIGSGIFEIVADFDGDTYRAVYAVKIEDAICILHAFQKKSKRGIATPKRELDLIAQRYRQAIAEAAGRK